MRMWMVEPEKMCRQHLMGEHVECHMLLGSLKRGRSIKGFLDKGELEPAALEKRHNELAEEMLRRGYNHKSDLVCNIELSGAAKQAKVNIKESKKELTRRCEQCRKNFG